MYDLAISLEALFRELRPTPNDDLGPQIHKVSALGLPAVEVLWWRSVDLDSTEKSLKRYGIVVQLMAVEPMVSLVDTSARDTFLTALAESAVVADRLNCPYLVVTPGDVLEGTSRSAQRKAVVSALREAVRVLEPYNAKLLLENLNSKVDHPGTFLDSTQECLNILDEVASPRIGMLYDLYHSLVMDEEPRKVLDGRIHHVSHVQVADVPGRHEPGTGHVDWNLQLQNLEDLGYRGMIGLEYIPATDAESSLGHILDVISRLNHINRSNHS